MFLFKHTGALLEGLFLAPIATLLLFHSCASPYQGDASWCLTSTVLKMGVAKGQGSVAAENTPLRDKLSKTVLAFVLVP